VGVLGATGCEAPRARPGEPGIPVLLSRRLARHGTAGRNMETGPHPLARYSHILAAHGGELGASPLATAPAPTSIQVRVPSLLARPGRGSSRSSQASQVVPSLTQMPDDPGRRACQASLSTVSGCAGRISGDKVVRAVPRCPPAPAVTANLRRTGPVGRRLSAAVRPASRGVERWREPGVIGASLRAPVGRQRMYGTVQRGT